jgi:hypothetical protein
MDGSRAAIPDRVWTDHAPVIPHQAWTDHAPAIPHHAWTDHVRAMPHHAWTDHAPVIPHHAWTDRAGNPASRVTGSAEPCSATARSAAYASEATIHQTAIGVAGVAAARRPWSGGHDAGRKGSRAWLGSTDVSSGHMTGCRAGNAASRVDGSRRHPASRMPGSAEPCSATARSAAHASDANIHQTSVGVAGVASARRPWSGGHDAGREAAEHGSALA